MRIGKLFRGTNRHDVRPRHHAPGRTWSGTWIEAAEHQHGPHLALPNNTLWYELADEYGLYLVDETNLKTRRPQYPGNHADWSRVCPAPRT